MTASLDDLMMPPEPVIKANAAESPGWPESARVAENSKAADVADPEIINRELITASSSGTTWMKFDAVPSMTELVTV